MKYIVCYVMHCSTEVEADSPDEAAEKADANIADVDDWEVTLVLDEGRNYVYR